MSILNFPNNPTDGQFYPSPPEPGKILYVWSDAKGAWLTVAMGVQRVVGLPPIFIQGTQQIPEVTMPAVSQTQDGYMTAADKIRLDNLAAGVSKIIPGSAISISPQTGQGVVTVNATPAYGSVAGTVFAGTGLATRTGGQMDLMAATSAALGGVIVGSGLQISPQGVLSAASGGLVVLRDISSGFNGVQTAFTLTRVDGTTYTPASSSSLLIFVGGILQVPGNAFSVSNAQIIFTQAPPTGASFYGLAMT